MLKSKVEGKIKALKKLPMKTKIVIAVGLAGILLIFVSEMFPAKNTAESKSIPTESVATDDTDSYKKQIEKEPKDVLSQVRGVGECTYIAPKLFGGRDAKTPVEGVGIPAPDDAFRLKNSRMERLGEDLLIESEVEYPCSQES